MTEQHIRQQKRALRLRMRQLRRRQPNKEEAAARVFAELMQSPEYRNATTLLFYVSLPDELPTHCAISDALSQGKRVVVPYCVGLDLGLFHLTDFEELQPGSLGILEPKLQLRYLQGREVAPSSLDLLIVPGLAFTPRGARLGQGRGYYDRLIPTLKDQAYLVGVAFECQLLESLPVAAHDAEMQIVITEKAVYHQNSGV